MILVTDSVGTPASNGVGIDYFFHPRVGGRLAVGLAGNMPAESNGDSPRFGYGYAAGMTVEMLDGPSRLSVDPALMVTNISQESYWSSHAVLAVTLNYVFN